MATKASKHKTSWTLPRNLGGCSEWPVNYNMLIIYESIYAISTNGNSAHPGLLYGYSTGNWAEFHHKIYVHRLGWRQMVADPQLRHAKSKARNPG